MIEAIEPAGVGALMALLDERRKRLAAEGLFDEARKQLLPFLPRTIGVVTSPTGAVIRDILHRIRERFPRDVLVWPVRVQGETAAAEVAAAIRGFNALEEGGRIPRPDVLIVARGGGSLEDLWAFNEEIVVRAAAESMIPLVSAIGHETDTTLIDFAADLRAPTPTGAAEKVVPVRVDLIAQHAELGRRHVHAEARFIEQRLTATRSLARILPTPDSILGARRQALDPEASALRKDMREVLARRRDRLARLDSVLARHAPQAELARARGRLDAASRELARCTQASATRRSDALANAATRLAAALSSRARLGRQQVDNRRATLAALAARMAPAAASLLARRRERLEARAQLFASLGYRNVLARGFALVRDEADAPLRSAGAVAPGQRLRIEFADGRVAATADGESGAPRAKNPPSRAKPAGGQGSLF